MFIKKLAILSTFATASLFVGCQVISKSSPKEQDNKSPLHLQVITIKNGDSDDQFLKNFKPDQWNYFKVIFPNETSYVSNNNINTKQDSLTFRFNCLEAEGKPSFLIEDHEGLDRLSSSYTEKLDILLDGQSFSNPFAANATNLKQFKTALAKARTIQFSADTYGAPFNFINKNSAATLKPVNCIN